MCVLSVLGIFREFPDIIIWHTPGSFLSTLLNNIIKYDLHQLLSGWGCPIFSSRISTSKNAFIKLCSVNCRPILLGGYHLRADHWNICNSITWMFLQLDTEVSQNRLEMRLNLNYVATWRLQSVTKKEERGKWRKIFWRCVLCVIKKIMSSK